MVPLSGIFFCLKLLLNHHIIREEENIMSKLKYTFKTDTLFKLLFTKNQHLLKKLISHILRIPLKDIKSFRIINTEMPPDIIGKKFCHLDINMTVNGQQVNLEVQVLSDISDNTCYPKSFVIRADFGKNVIAAA